MIEAAQAASIISPDRPSRYFATMRTPLAVARIVPCSTT